MIPPAVPVNKLGIATICRQHTGLRDERSAEPHGVDLKQHHFRTNSGHEVIPQYSRSGLGVRSDSLAFDESKSRVVMSKGVDRHVTELSTECAQSVYPDAGAHVHEVSSTVSSIEQRT